MVCKGEAKGELKKILTKSKNHVIFFIWYSMLLAGRH